EFTNEQVRQALRISAADIGTTGKDGSFGYGRGDAAQAVHVDRGLTPRLASPTNASAIAIVPVDVTGRADGAAFRNYILDYGAGAANTTWTTLRNSTTPVTNGTLGVLDPSTPGVYALRLRAFDTTGKAFV